MTPATKGMRIWRGGRRELLRSKERSMRGYIYSGQYSISRVYCSKVQWAEYIIVQRRHLLSVET